MTRIAFIGKQHVTNLEDAYLDALGMALGNVLLHADIEWPRAAELATTPAGGAALALARGFEAATGRQPRLLKRPVTRDVDQVLFYDDNRLYQALLAQEPSPIEDHWVLLTSIKRLELYASIALSIVAEDKDIAA